MTHAGDLAAPKSFVWKQAHPFMKPKILFGGSTVVILFLMGLLAPQLSPFNPNAQDLSVALRAPQWLSGPHVLGTDPLGRDVLSRIFYGARVSIMIGMGVAFLSGLIGITLGATSGFYSGKIDLLIQKLVEVMWAFPPLLFAIALDRVSRPELANPDHRAGVATLDSLLPRRESAGAESALARLYRRGARARRHQCPHLAQAHYSKSYTDIYRHRNLRDGDGNHFRGESQLPWARGTAQHSDMGIDACRCSGPYQHIVVAAAVSGTLHPHDGAWDQPAWRWPAGRSGPEAQPHGHGIGALRSAVKSSD